MNPMSNHEKKDHLQSSRGKGILIDPQKYDVIAFNMINHPASHLCEMSTKGCSNMK